MSSKFQKRTSNIFVTLLIGLIVVSFMVTGVQTMRGTPDTIAKVGDIPIKAREYQNEYQRQIQFYKNLFGGKDLSAEQIKQFRIQTNTINSLVQRKLWIHLANQSGANPSKQQIIDEIQKQPYFQTNKQFDFQKYKGVLTSNRLTMSDYEKLIAQDLRGQSAQALLASFPLTRKYLQEIEIFKKKKLQINAVEVTRQALLSSVPVSAKEINVFLAVPQNLARTQSLFNDRKASLDKPEQVKARHILLKTTAENEAAVEKKINALAKKATPKNFAKLAAKHTEDPTGIQKGGDLGWFGKGRMVPAFEDTAFTQKPGTISKPVKSNFGYHIIYVEKKRKAKPAVFGSFKKTLAEELVRKSKGPALEALTQNTVKNIATAYQKGNFKKVDRIVAKYKFKSDKKVELNRFDGSLGQVPLPAKEVKVMFAKDLNKKRTFSFSTGASVAVVNTSPFVLKKKSPKDMLADQEKERNGLRMVLARKLSQEVIKNLKDNTKVKVFNNVIRQ